VTTPRFVALCGIVFVVWWIVAAFFVKRTVERERWLPRVLIAAALVILPRTLTGRGGDVGLDAGPHLEERLLMNRAWLPAEPFDRFDRIEVAPSEPAAANGLLVAGRVIYASAFPRTLERLVRRGVRTVVVETSELAKAEGALTCCCLLVDGREVRGDDDGERPFGMPTTGQNRNP
jgi:hypothetical protein